MDFPVREVLIPLSENGNIVAMQMLKGWDTFLSTDVDVEPLIKKLIQRHGEKKSASPEEADTPVTSSNISHWRGRDLRIRDLMVSGYRGIPYKKDQFYGLSFVDSNPFVDIEDTEDRDVCSLIVMGFNGSGKTSLYSAIELAILQNTSIERKHKIKSEDIKKFRHYLENMENPIHIYLKTNDDTVTPRFCEMNQSPEVFDINSYIDLTPFFCSESELAITECSGTNMTDYIDKTIGLNTISMAITILDGVIKSINDNYSSIKARIDVEKREATEEEASSLNLWAELQEQAVEVSDGLNDKRVAVKNEVLLHAQKIIEGLMKEYESDDVKLSFTSTEDGKKMFNGMLRIEQSGVEIDPRHYFNNFRFKLYMVSIQIAIAFYIMKSRKVQFPLIFDDIFDSSDFNNRNKSKEFFERILKQYSELEISDKPLQLILFTQDEIIAESVYDGILECRRDNEKNYNVSGSKLVQLFSPHDTCEDTESEDMRILTLNLSKDFEDNGDKDAADVDSTTLFYKNLYDVVREFRSL